MAKAAVKASKKPKVSVHDEILAAITESDDEFAGFRGNKATKKETEQEYVLRLCNGANDMPQESWDALSEEAQSYLNATLMQINDKKNKKALALPPGMDGEEEEEEDEDEKPAPKAKGKAKAAPEPEEEDEDEADEEDEEEDEKPAPKAKGKGKPAPAPAAKGKATKAKAEPEEDDEEDDEDEKPAKTGKGSFGGKKATPFAPKPDGVTFQTRLAIAKHKKFVDITIDELRAALSKVGITDAKSSSLNTILGDMKSTVRALEAAGRLAK